MEASYDLACDWCKAVDGLTQNNSIKFQYPEEDPDEIILNVFEYLENKNVTCRSCNSSNYSVIAINGNIIATNWWNSLDDSWKKLFESILGEEIGLFPKEAQMQKLLSLDKLDCSYTNITSLTPLKYFQNLKEIKLQGVKNISFRSLDEYEIIRPECLLSF